MNKPQQASAVIELQPGISAAAPGVLWMHASETIVAADVHLAYEDVIGAALPLWSTRESIAALENAARSLQAREIILLGDIIHGARMSEGAARAVSQGLERLRSSVRLTLVAGNHEGRSRGSAVLGETVEHVERDGWMLVHGDRPAVHERAIIGHLHPSLALGARASAPAFVASERVIVVPALTPYSRGLNVLSDAFLRALEPWGISSSAQLHVAAAADGVLYPFGSVAKLRTMLRPGG